jgi:hypothetical protein
MSATPLVCAVMLVNGRPEMVKRAVKCFDAQSYENRILLLYDTTEDKFTRSGASKVFHYWCSANERTVGELRNAANSHHRAWNSDIIVHWDSDDWSHPERIQEQVGFLIKSEAQCVGYNRLLFWRSPRIVGSLPTGETWLYDRNVKNYAVGTSLCYWRKTWSGARFLPLPTMVGGTSEDTEFLKMVDCRGEAGFSNVTMSPRLIARIHPGNTQYYGTDLLEASASWSRFPAMDRFCAEAMEK